MTQDKDIYIVGGGSFASQTLRFLQDVSLNAKGFIDELCGSQKEGLPVLTEKLLKKSPLIDNAIFIMAISFPEHAKNAYTRLINLGVAKERILDLQDVSSLVILKTLHNQGYDVVKQITQSPLSNAENIEQCLLGDIPHRIAALNANKMGEKNDRDSEPRRSDKKSIIISANFYSNKSHDGGGGGFRQHINPLMHKLKKVYNVVSFSDVADEASESSVNLVLQGNITALSNNYADLAITSHFVSCAHPDTPKITFMHSIYDCFLLYDLELYYDMLLRAFSQSKRQYIFMPSRPAFDDMKERLIHWPHPEDVILIPGGYPRLDNNRLHFLEKSNTVKADSIVYAPSTGAIRYDDDDKAELIHSIFQAREILEALVKSFPQYKIIFRPHPKDLALLDLGKKGKMADALRRALDFCDGSKCILDNARSEYMDSYSRAAIMVSDVSSTAFTFALATRRPVAFISPGNSRLYSELLKCSYIHDRQYFGSCVDNVSSMVDSVKDMLTFPDKYKKKINEQANKILFNADHSEDYFLSVLPTILANERHPDFWYLRDHKQN